jgi:uncharacterized protein (DUF1810 family)
MRPDAHELARFVRAQESVFASAVQDLRDGRKRGRWMWFVFPQLKSLGMSATAREVGFASLDEDRAYLAHALLGARLLECAGLVSAFKAKPRSRSSDRPTISNSARR